eukprot:6192447-Pleurochrysis_carterae.AAC.2
MRIVRGSRGISCPDVSTCLHPELSPHPSWCEGQGAPAITMPTDGALHVLQLSTAPAIPPVASASNLRHTFQVTTSSVSCMEAANARVKLPVLKT